MQYFGVSNLGSQNTTSVKNVDLCWAVLVDLFFAPLVSNYDFFDFIRKQAGMQGYGEPFNIVIVIGSIIEQFIIIFWTWLFELNRLLIKI